MNTENLFDSHTKEILERTKTALKKNRWDALVIHSGSRQFFHADDQEIPFRTVPHFTRFILIETPNHLLFISRDNEKPFFVEVIPEDFWEESAPAKDEASKFWRSEFDGVSFEIPEEAWERVREKMQGKVAFIGDRQAYKFAKAQGISKDACNPVSLLSDLDASRSK